MRDGPTPVAMSFQFSGVRMRVPRPFKNGSPDRSDPIRFFNTGICPYEIGSSTTKRCLQPSSPSRCTSAFGHHQSGGAVHDIGQRAPEGNWRGCWPDRCAWVDFLSTCVFVVGFSICVLAPFCVERYERVRHLIVAATWRAHDEQPFAFTRSFFAGSQCHAPSASRPPPGAASATTAAPPRAVLPPGPFLGGAITELCDSERADLLLALKGRPQ
jgi:hypothetical protein